MFLKSPVGSGAWPDYDGGIVLWGIWVNQRTLGILRKIGLTAVEVVMVLAVLLVLAIVALMLRLQAGSLDIAFAKSFLQTELNEINPAIAELERELSALQGKPPVRKIRVYTSKGL